MNENSTFCPNCGAKLASDAVFCEHCGCKLAAVTSPITQPAPESIHSGTFTENLAKNNPITPFLQKGKTFVLKYKVVIGAVTAVCLLMVIGITIFNNVYDFTKLEWDDASGDSGLSLTSARTLRLSIVALDKDDQPIPDIQFTTESGTLEVSGHEVVWYLPEQTGNYSISATAPSGKTIEKTIEVVALDEGDLVGMIDDAENDDSADNDHDGLSNALELQHGTDPDSADTDQDGLIDSYEINVSHTDPLKADTDNDGIDDGDELDLGLDPLKSDSRGDGVQDGDRTLTFAVEDSKLGITLNVTGKGNLASTTIDLVQNAAFTEHPEIINKIYNFYTAGTLTQATVTIPYDPTEAQEKQISESDLVLYYFDDKTKHLEAVPTVVDQEQHLLTAELTHFSKYVIGNKNLTQAESPTDIMFVIDNSISMYTESQMNAAGYTEVTGATGNDINFNRLSLTNEMINQLTGNYRFGVAEFAGSYTKLQSFTSDPSVAQSAINSMESNWQVNLTGTNLADALTRSIAEFKDDNTHYVVLLTDGKDTSYTFSSKQNGIISSAQAANVKVCIIGLGQDIDTDILVNIAEKTGCKYYNASNATALGDFYNLISADINYGYIDTDSDGNTDGMIIYDSGFVTTRNGFSFANFTSNKSDNGHCYGMATFAMFYYTNQLPLTLSAKDTSRFYLGNLKRVDFAADGYDLTGTFFDKGADLYNFQFTTPGLDIYMHDNPADYRDRIEDDTWLIKSEYHDQLANLGFQFLIKDYTKSDKSFTKYQSALLQIGSSDLAKNATADENGLLEAIWRLFILQANDKHTSFNSDPDKAYALLTDELSAGTPVVLGINRNHAINAVRLIQDNTDVNKFKLEVYDNNYPGEVRYIDIYRKKFNKIQLDYTAWTNEYSYTFYYDLGGETKKIPVEITTVTIE